MVQKRGLLYVGGWVGGFGQSNVGYSLFETITVTSSTETCMSDCSHVTTKEHQALSQAKENGCSKLAHKN